MKSHTILPTLAFLLILSACQSVEPQPVFSTSSEVSLTPIPLQNTPPERLATLPGAILSFAISPDGSRIAFATSQGLLLYDLQTYELLQTLAEGQIINSLAWSPDGTQLAAGVRVALPNPSEFAGAKAVLKIWDVSTWQMIFEPDFNKSMVNERINDLAFSPNGKRLAFSADVSGVMTFDLANGKTISHQKEYAGSVMSLAWSPDSSRLISTGDMASSVRRWIVKNDKAVRLFDQRADNPMRVAWTPDGQRIVSGHVNGVVCFWTTASNKCDGFIKAHRSAVFSMALSPDGSQLATGGGIIRIWDTQTGELLSAFGLDEQILYTKIAWARPDNQLIVLETGMENPELTRVRIWDPASGVAKVEFLGGERFPTAAAMDPQEVPINTQRTGAWTIYSAQEWLQTGETVVISGIAGDPHGSLWFGTIGGPVSHGTGLYRFDGRNWTRYSMDNGLPADEISSLAVNPNGELWLTTFCCGAAQFDGDTWKIFTRQDGLPEDDVRASLIDQQGNLWLGFSKKGVARFDGETWQTFPLKGYVGHLGLLADGSVLASVSDNSNPRLARFDGKQWTNFETPPEMQQAYVFDFAETPAGVLWFATEHDGAFRLSGGEWTQYTTSDGLSSDSVLALAVAPNGDIWFGTPNGITRFDGESWETYQPGKGIVSAFAAADGSLWFGADSTILRYAPEKSE
jgi:WD40 repeat protein